MKTTAKLISILMLMLFSLTSINLKSDNLISNNLKSNSLNSNNLNSNLNADVSFQIFYDGLSPYGTWIDYPNRGYVWVPNVGAGFVPYQDNGHWVYTDDGWTWFSGYSWGWAPFHYGRWFFDDSYGWMWFPGYDWAPAWVVWGECGGYYGWAPIEPGVGLYSGYRPPFRYWSFVPREHFGDARLSRWISRDPAIAHERISTIDNRHSFNKVNYFAGPKSEEVAKYTHRKITPSKLEERDRPLSNKEVKNIHPRNRTNSKPVPVYRPHVAPEQNAHHAPAKVGKMENLRPVNKGQGFSGGHRR